MSNFICVSCRKEVDLSAPGTRNRNHCPFCLHSLHVDDKPGDRGASCEGDMEPVGKFYKKDGEEMVIHQCVKCGFVRWNRVAGDDSIVLMEELPILEDPRKS